jgi:hypothetical protein
MAYAFVQAQYHGPAGSFRELRALTVHMAEGGGTVSWLTHPSNPNSSHFVIEYSGRIVQMVTDDQYDYSLHVARPYGPPGAGDSGIFSLDTAKAVLGADGIADPNRYMFAVELEGFAAVGPNSAQVASLAALIRDLRSRFPTMRGNLGHRDFQNYKPCPGGSIPWATIGGHGPYSAAPAAGVDPMNLKTDIPPIVVDVAAGTTLVDSISGSKLLTLTKATPMGMYAKDAANGRALVRVDLGSGGSDLHGAYVPLASITEPVPPPTGDYATGYAAAKKAAIEAAEAI